MFKDASPHARPTARPPNPYPPGLTKELIDQHGIALDVAIGHLRSALPPHAILVAGSSSIRSFGRSVVRSYGRSYGRSVGRSVVCLFA